MNDPCGRPTEPGRTAIPSRNGHVAPGSTRAGLRACPTCGAAGVRFIRSTGRWYRGPSGASTFGYVTFCAACGHEYGEVATD